MSMGIQRWIDVRHVTPCVGNTILIRLENNAGEAEVDAAYLDNQQVFVTFNGWPMNVWTITHWMPMPDAEIER